MRVVIFGASGNVGIALIRALTAGTAGHEIIGVARRKPSTAPGGAEWVAADIAEAQLEHIVRGADAVVHLAWLIQPSRSPEELRSVNIGGTARLLAAVAAERVPVFVYASSVGAYSPAPKAHPVDESWPTHGIDTSSYSRQKAYTERMLDAFEARNPDIRTVRLRPALIFQTEASASQRRYFAGPFLPRAVPVPVAVARTAMDLTWRLRLQPTPTGWLDMAFHCPVLDASRARAELGWTPGFSGREAVRTVLRGIALGAAGPTPPLQEMSVGEHLRQARR